MYFRKKTKIKTTRSEAVGNLVSQMVSKEQKSSSQVVLQLAMNTEAEVKKYYLQQVMKWHPDRIAVHGLPNGVTREIATQYGKALTEWRDAALARVAQNQSALDPPNEPGSGPAHAAAAASSSHAPPTAAAGGANTTHYQRPPGASYGDAPRQQDTQTDRERNAQYAPGAGYGDLPRQHGDHRNAEPDRERNAQYAPGTTYGHAGQTGHSTSAGGSQSSQLPEVTLADVLINASRPNGEGERWARATLTRYQNSSITMNLTAYNELQRFIRRFDQEAEHARRFA